MRERVKFAVIASSSCVETSGPYDGDAGPSYTSRDGLLTDMRQLVSNAEIYNGHSSILAQVRT